MEKKLICLDGNTNSVRLMVDLSADGIEVDRDKGILRNVAIITRGPAIGHGFDVARSYDDMIDTADVDGVWLAHGVWALSGSNLVIIGPVAESGADYCESAPLLRCEGLQWARCSLQVFQECMALTVLLLRWCAC